VRVAAGLLLALLAVPASGQTANAVVCGTYKAESKQTASSTQWTIARGAEKSSETAVLRSGPRFECIDDAVLAVEFTTSANNAFVDLYFPDGSNIGYSRQQVERRNNRFVLPIQAKPRIDAKFRAAFDYHCRFELPADPIPAASRADCIF
jgi:hypothetical protein